MKEKKKCLVIGLVIILVFVLGCVDNTSPKSATDEENTPVITTTVQTAETSVQTAEASPVQTVDKQRSPYDPVNIRELSSYSEGDFIRFFFILEDSKGKNMTADGHADFKINDSAGNIVFTKNFEFRASEFVDYKYLDTGQYAGRVYEWRVNQKDIQKGVEDTGTAEIIITINGNNLKAIDSYVKIQSYTDEELMQMFYDQYNKNATRSGDIIRGGNFEVNIEKYGFYTYFNRWDNKYITNFRVDLKVKNIGSYKDSYYVYDSVIISGANQYDIDDSSSNIEDRDKPYSKLHTSDIYPGIIKEGYLIFKGVPKTLKGPMKIIVGQSYDQYNKYSYYINIK